MKKSNFLVLGILILLSGCSDPDRWIEEGQDKTLSVAQVAFSRKSANGADGTSKSSFEQGDVLMLYLPGQGDNPYRKITLTSSGWALDYPVSLSGSQTDIYGCYPALYNGDTFPIEHITGMDYLYSSVHTVNLAKPVLYLEMKHALALIEFEFEPFVMTGDGIVDLISIEGEGLHSRATISLLSGELTYEERIHEPAVIYGWQMENPFIGSDTRIGLMVVPVREVKSDGDITFSMHINSSKYHWPVPAGTIWESGKRYTYKVHIRDRILEITGVRIQDWIDAGNEKINLYYYD